jgi:DNA polymerase III sliding clamp (beta) subunit (PCNA family)
MKFVADRVDVLSALAKCGIASEEKSPHPNYRTCFITSDGKNRVICHAMNEHLSVRVGFPAGVTETGKMTVNTKKFTELVGMLPEGRVEFSNKGAKETEKQVLKSLVAKRQDTLNGMVLDHPAFDQPPSTERVVDAGEVMDGWSKIQFAMETDKNAVRPMGGEITFARDHFRIQTVNGHAMARVVFGEGTALVGKLFVPHTAFLVIRLMAKDDRKLRMSADERRLYCQNADTTFSVALPGRDFGEQLDQGFSGHVQASKHGPRCTVDAQLFADGVRSAAAIGIDVERHIACIDLALSSSGTITMSSENAQGESTEEVASISSTSEFKYSFDGKYLFQSTNQMEGEIEIADSVGNGCLVISQGAYTALVMRVLKKGEVP